jgi:hypothetical protein
MSSRNITKNLKNRKNLVLDEAKIYNTNYQSSRELLGKTYSQRKAKSQLAKVILKGKLFGLINKTNIMTDEQFNDIKIKLSLSHLEKYKENKKKLNEKFYYAQNSPNILTYYRSSGKFEDDYINMRDLLNKKFTTKEQKTILSFPQFFQLNSNVFLKELVEEKHKNLYEIIGSEEKKEIQKRSLKRKIRVSNISPKRAIFENISNDSDSKIINDINYKNKIKSRNIHSNNILFKNNNSTNKIKSTYHTNNTIVKTVNENNKTTSPLIKNKRNYFHYDMGTKYKIISKMIENKKNEKFEGMKRRKELIIENNKMKMDMIKEKNSREQMKKERERLKIYHEKKYIEYIVAKLKKNYIQTNRDNENEDKNSEEKNEEDENKSNDSKSNIFDFLKKNEGNIIKSSIM